MVNVLPGIYELKLIVGGQSYVVRVTASEAAELRTTIAKSLVGGGLAFSLRALATDNGAIRDPNRTVVNSTMAIIRSVVGVSAP